jgi:hypothetical protein
LWMRNIACRGRRGRRMLFAKHVFLRGSWDGGRMEMMDARMNAR